VARAEVTGKKPTQTADEADRLPGPPIEDAKAIEPRGKGGLDVPTSARRPPVRGPPVRPACFSVRTFCEAHHLSEAMYFKMKAAGWAPQEMRVGSRILISFEAAERWRKEREAISQQIED
jgi:hypothetical protein